jgi:hypothetical protein
MLECRVIGLRGRKGIGFVLEAAYGDKTHRVFSANCEFLAPRASTWHGPASTRP